MLFRSLNFEFDEKSIVIPRSISGTDRFDTAVKLSEAAGCINNPSMVLFNDNRSIDAYIATSACGFLNATPLYLHNDAIPSGTALAAFKSRPKDVYAIGTTATAESIAQGLSHEDYAPSVTILESDLCLDSTETYRYFKEQGALWGDTAIVYSALNPNYGISLLSLMPYVYVNHAPVFNVDGEKGQERILSVIDDFKRIVFVGTTRGRVTPIYEHARSGSFEIVEFDGKEPYEANAIVNDWIAQEWKKEGCETFGIVVSSLTNTIDNTIIGAYAGSQHALLLFEDVKDVDSVSMALMYIGEHAHMIEGFEFLGDGNRFDDSEKLLLCKRLIMGKAQSATQ